MALNILLVDDSDLIRAMIARTLCLTDIALGDVFHASNGREALEVLQNEWVDLVLADLNMPVMDGAEMLEKMRANAVTADVPVIVVSTEGATQRIDDLSAKGVSAWVRKPFTPEEIRDVIQGVTEQWRPGPEVGRALDDVFARVVENFAFAFPEKTTPPALPAPNEPLLCADIAFSGAVTGTMSIVSPVALCVEMAANVLGVDPDDEQARDRGADTLAELLNMCAGHLCSTLQPHASTQLHPPAVVRFDAADLAEWGVEADVSAYSVEDETVLLRLSLRDRKPMGGR